MSFDEDDELGAGFKMNIDEEAEPLLDMPEEEVGDFGLDEEDPDRDH